jgi:hypothetical protein
MCVAANLHLFLHTRYWNCLTHWIYFLTLISWFVFAPLYCTIVCVFLGASQMYGVMMMLYSTPLFYLIVILWSWVSLLPDFLYVYLRRTYVPKASYVLQEVVNEKEWKLEHKPSGRWCCEKGDCCCQCCKHIWCECC